MTQANIEAVETIELVSDVVTPEVAEVSVKADLTDDKSDRHAQPQRPRRDADLQPFGHPCMGAPRHGRQGQRQQQPGDQTVRKEIRQVLPRHLA